MSEAIGALPVLRVCSCISAAPGLFEEAERAVQEALRQTFRPELLGRLDEVVIFRPLSPGAVREIARRKLSTLGDRLKEQGISLEVTEGALELLVREGYDYHYGARPLARAIRRHVESPLAKLIVDGQVSQGGTVRLEARGDELALVPLEEREEAQARG